MIIRDEAPLPDNPLAPLRLLATVDRNTIESKIEKVASDCGDHYGMTGYE